MPAPDDPPSADNSDEARPPSADSDEARALDLLRATHDFPVDYHVSVITRHDEAIFSTLRQAVEQGHPLPPDAYQRTPSSGGKYASHRFRVPVDSAESVLALYARIRAIEGVLSIL
jgi:putative lipoic acid-binding regulatory protein